MACGFVNGCVVVYGRSQPIIATLATGAVFRGLALLLRPTPGGDVDEDLSWVMTSDLYELVASYDLADAGEAERVVLLAAVSLGALAILRVRNSLDQFR